MLSVWNGPRLPVAPRLSVLSCATIAILLIATGCGSATRGSQVVTSAPVMNSSNGLTLKVDDIEKVNGRFTVYTHVTNSTTDSLTLALDDFFLIDEGSGKSYPCNIFSRGWTEEIPPGATVAGSIQINGPLERGPRTLRAGFSHVFGSFNISNITATGINVAG
jgi:hypothetical protein